MPKLTPLNDDLYNQLDSVYQRRYDNAFAWSRAISLFQMLVGLRGVWPMSSVDNTGAVYDLSGQGRTLSYNGNPIFAFTGLYPSISMDGAGDYLSRADEAGLDITGTESVIWSNQRGLTLGGWFNFNTLAPGATIGLIGKWNGTGNQRSYQMFFDDATNSIYLDVSTDGTAVVDCQGDVVAVSQWYFLVGRFTPSTELAVFVNGSKQTNTVGIPASIYSGTANFNIGAYANGGSGQLNGFASICFLCASALSDTIIKSLYHFTRPLFGIR